MAQNSVITSWSLSRWLSAPGDAFMRQRLGMNSWSRMRPARAWPFWNWCKRASVSSFAAAVSEVSIASTMSQGRVPSPRAGMFQRLITAALLEVALRSIHSRRRSAISGRPPAGLRAGAGRVDE